MSVLTPDAKRQWRSFYYRHEPWFWALRYGLVIVAGTLLVLAVRS